jgi:CubicO group peptidase (beta-lactamase class C family)
MISLSRSLNIGYLVFFVLVAMGIGSSTSYAQSKSYQASIDRDVTQLLRDFRVPGAAIAIIQDGKVSYLKTFGLGESNRAITRDSVFGVASLSKLVTAWGVMHLVDKGRLDLDAPISSYLTPEQLTRFNSISAQITARQLLSHTSGLAFRSVSEYWPGDSIPTLEDELGRKSANGAPVLRQTTPPGSEWSYSGGGYGLLQVIIENVSGKPFAQYMGDAMLKPLGMNHSFFGNPETDAPPRVVVHYDETGKPIQRLGYANLAAAAFYTTISDFSKMALADVTRNGHDVVKASDFQMMESAAPGTKETFGLGYFIEHLHSGESIVGHDGSDIGWNSIYRIIPSRHGAFIMFTSSSTGLAVYAQAICRWYKTLYDEDRPDYCKPSGLEIIVDLYRSGVSSAVQRYSELKTKYGQSFSFPQAYWNFIAYGMMSRHDPTSAIALFELLTQIFPESANEWDSLGDGYVATGNSSRALESYKHALQIDPTLKSAKAAVTRLSASAPQ